LHEEGNPDTNAVEGTCVYCANRKGKRSCPALGGQICSPCCGQHRLVTISCPTHCIYLGGLAVVRDADGWFTKEDYNTAVPKLMAFARTGTPPDPGVGKLIGGEAAEWEQSAVTGFLLYGHRDREGSPIASRRLRPGPCSGRCSLPVSATASTR